MQEIYNKGQERVLKKFHVDTLEDNHLSLTEAKELTLAADIEGLNSDYKIGLYKDIARKIYAEQLGAEKGVLDLFSNKIKELKGQTKSEGNAPMEGPREASPRANQDSSRYPGLIWLNFRDPAKLRNQFTMMPVSLIASYNFMVGKVNFPESGLSATTISMGANAGIKLYNSLRIFFNYENSEGTTQGIGLLNAANVTSNRYRGGIGLNVPIHSAWLQTKFDLLLGRGDMESQALSSRSSIENLFSVGIAPQICTVWDFVCLGYQFSRDSTTDDTRTGAIDLPNDTLVNRENKFTFSLNLGSFFDWRWWKRSRSH